MVSIPRIPWSRRKRAWTAMPRVEATLRASARLVELDADAADVAAEREYLRGLCSWPVPDRLADVPEPTADDLREIETPPAPAGAMPRNSRVRTQLLDVVRGMAPGSTTREIAAEFGGTEGAVLANLIALRKLGLVRNSVAPKGGVMSTWETTETPPPAPVVGDVSAVDSNPRLEEAVHKILSAHPAVSVTVEELAGDLDRHVDHVEAALKSLMRAGKVKRVIRGGRDALPSWQVFSKKEFDALVNDPKTWIVEDFNEPTPEEAAHVRPAMIHKGPTWASRVLAVLRAEGDLDTNAIARRLGMSRHLAGTTLCRMKAAGGVEIVGSAIGRKLRTWRAR